MHLAAFFGLDIQTQQLIEKGKIVDSTDSLNRTALYMIASTGHHKIVTLLLDAGGQVPGRVVNGSQRWDLTKMWYYPPWARDDYRGEALEVAAEGGHEETVTLLLRNKANLHDTGGIHNSPLEAGVFGGHVNIVMLLLREGATVRKSILQASGYNGDVKILRILINHLLDPESKPTRELEIYPYNYGRTSTKLLHVLCAAALANRLSCAELLFEYHVDANAEIWFLSHSTTSSSIIWSC